MSIDDIKTFTALTAATVALASLALNLILAWQTPRRDYARWRRDKLAEYVLDVIMISGDMRGSITNLRAIPMAGTNQTVEELASRPEHVAVAIEMQNEQWPLLDPHIRRMIRPLEAIETFGPPRLQSAAAALTAASNALIERLAAGVRERRVVFGEDFAQMQRNWLRAEDAFRVAASLELGSSGPRAASG